MRPFLPLFGSLLVLVSTGCLDGTVGTPPVSLMEHANGLPYREGTEAYRATPYVTAGDRVYLVGHQDGSFPDLGWHVEGEMGGLWDHPVKLLDGFVAHLADSTRGVAECLTSASRFINYPLANTLIYDDVAGIRVSRFQFVPDGLEGFVVEFTLENRSSNPRSVTLSFTGWVDLMPVWLAERKGIIDGADALTWAAEHDAVVARDGRNEWYVVFGSDAAPARYDLGKGPCPVTRKGRGVDATLAYDLTIEPGGTVALPLYVAGSYTAREAALATYGRLRQQAVYLLEAKKARYDALKATADLQIPDADVQDMYTWIKYNTDWLVRDVPERGRGLSAGLPDYPWWFGADNAYALQGVLATGRPDLAVQTLRLLHDLSASTNGNGRIIHEASTNGVVFNPGNLNETPHLAVTTWLTYAWTGDRDFLADVYPLVKQGLDWLMTTQDRDGNGYPDGAGMMEIHGLTSEMIDVVVYTQQAFAAAARMAAELGEPEYVDRYGRIARQLKQRINDDWWVDEADSFADFKATPRQALDLIDDALVRADTLGKAWAVDELRAARERIEAEPSEEARGFVVHHNWVVNTPMEMGVADTARALRALETARRYTNPFGVYVTGIDGEAPGSGAEDLAEAMKWQSFSYVGAVMTLPTGVQAVAEARYGNTEAAYDYLQRLARSFSYALPGSMYEVSPDYGMVVQAWNVYAVAVPIVRYFFGIEPRAFDRHVTVRPRLPGSWREARLSDLPIGDNLLTVDRRTEGGVEVYTIDHRRDGWTLDVNLPNGPGARVVVDGTPVTPAVEGGSLVVRLTGRHHVVHYTPPRNR